MNILNVMWGGGTDFVSVHKVHRDILKLSERGSSIVNLLLQGGEAPPLMEVGPVSCLGLSSARIKGRGLASIQRLIDRRRLVRWITVRRPQVILLDGMGVATYVLPLLRELTQVRVVVLFHGNKRIKPEQSRLLQAFPAERLELMAVSATLAADIQHQTGCKVSGVRVALRPDTLRLSLLNKEAARDGLGLPVAEGRGRIIGAVGRLVSEKGFSQLIEVLAEELRANPDDRLVILGEGPEREALSTLASKLGISTQVFLLGHVAEAVRLYRAFDLLCIPSRQEGLGLVLSEAVIAGVPVLASDLPVFREQLAGGVGLLPVDQKPAWKAALSFYLRGNLAELAQAQMAGMNPESAWKDFVECYRCLLR
ncbi:glycosyltransferase [Pseudomonas sp. SH1-B]